MKKFHGEGSVGLISSKLSLEGPIIKDKLLLSFLEEEPTLTFYQGPLSIYAITNKAVKMVREKQTLVVIISGILMPKSIINSRKPAGFI